MELLTQTDKNWKNNKLGHTNETIGASGCVISSLCNCHNLAGGDLTPDELNRMLTEINGYTKDGALIWAKAEQILEAKITPWAWESKSGLAKLNEVIISDNSRTFWICRFLNKTVLHFTNVLQFACNSVVIFDVYDGKTKVLYKKDINRLVKVVY